MIKPEIPINEEQRIDALYEYEILDTLPDEDLDGITRLASQICQTPISLISLVDTHRQWFKSRYGIDAKETPREVAFCAHAINHPKQTFLVPDSRLDERFADNPLVTGYPNIVFYAGVPLVTPNGYAIGTLCIVDKKPKNLQQHQIDALNLLGEQVIRLFELRKANIELKKAKKILEDRNIDLQKFASVVSHDIKSPLSTISSSIDLLKLYCENCIDERRSRVIEYIDGSATKLRMLVDGILEYYRSDQLLLKPKEVIEVGSLISSVIEMLEFPEATVFMLPEKGEIKVNRSAITQIFLNLLSNSIRYNNKPTPIVSITFNSDEEYHHFTITDNGMGIDQEKIDQVFDLFMIINKKDVKGIDSTGIGLPTVKKLIEHLGGKITVESVPNEFTKVWFTIRKS